LPGDVFIGDGAADSDVGFGHEHVDEVGCLLDDRHRHRHRRSAGQHKGQATGGNRDAEHYDTSYSHTLMFPEVAPGLSRKMMNELEMPAAASA